MRYADNRDPRSSASRLAIASVLSLGHIVLTVGLMLKTNGK